MFVPLPSIIILPEHSLVFSGFLLPETRSSYHEVRFKHLNYRFTPSQYLEPSEYVITPVLSQTFFFMSMSRLSRNTVESEEGGPDRRILMAVDFGTTYSGLAWSQTRKVSMYHFLLITKLMCSLAGNTDAHHTLA